MLNILWPIFIIISFTYGIFTGRVAQINGSIFDSAASSVELSITLLGTLCLWNGMMQVASKTKLIKQITSFLSPLMRFLFPDIRKDEKVYDEMSMNMVANIMGLGNAATPLGLKAMTSLQEKNPKKDTLSDSMITFIVLNTASLQIIPTTVIAIRSSLQSQNPTGIILPVWIATICAAVGAICTTKILLKREAKKKK